MKTLLFLDSAGPAIIYIIIAYSIPAALFLICSWIFRYSTNKFLRMLGNLLCFMISVSCIGIGWYVATEYGLLITSLAGLFFAGMGVYIIVLDSQARDQYILEEQQKLAKLTELAEAGNIEAQHQLGRIYLDKKDYEKAEIFLQNAASQDCNEAINLLGRLYYETEKYAEAKECWLKTAATNNSWSQYNLGKLSFEFNDFDEANRWWRLSAEQGNAIAQFSLGELLYSKFRVHTEARQWISKSAKQGYSPAMNRLNELKYDYK
jgi:TPR repeat protein